MAQRKYKLTGYSSFPYTGQKLDDELNRAREFLYAFKNGRGYPPKSYSFAQVVEQIVKHSATCPVFQGPAVLVPIPRSGSSRESFQPHANTFPCLQLAEELARAHHLEVAELLTRESPVRCSSDSSKRVTIAEHLDSLAVDCNLPDSRIVLLDDLLTKGTQVAACVIALRAAGFPGKVEGYFVSQTLHRERMGNEFWYHQVHEIEWWDGNRYPSRQETVCWSA